MNKIWSYLLIISITFSMFFGDISSLGNVMLSSALKAWEMFLQIGVLLLFWSGIFEIAIDSSLINKISKILKKPIHFLYPELSLDSLAYQYLCSNMVANLLGLGSAATPLGIMAFKEMQKCNSQKDTATRSMITMCLINSSSLTIIPTTIISLRTFYNGKTSINLIALMILSTSLSTFIAVVLDRIFYRCTNK